jgi:hypothetical protein
MRIFTGMVSILVLAAACAVRTPIASSWEQDIRAAEQRHVTAFRANDPAAIEAILADDFLVNSPRYVVVDKRQLMALVQTTAHAPAEDRAVLSLRWRLRRRLPRRVAWSPSQPVPDCDAPNVRRDRGNRWQPDAAPARRRRGSPHLPRWQRRRGAGRASCTSLGSYAAKDV